NRFDAEHPEKSVSIETESSKQARNTSQLSEHFQATGKAVDLLPKAKGSSLEERALSAVLSPGEDLPQVRQEILSELKSGIDKLPKDHSAGLKKLMERPDARTPQRLHQALLEMGKSQPELESLQALRSLSGTWQAMEDAP